MQGLVFTDLHTGLPVIYTSKTEDFQLVPITILCSSSYSFSARDVSCGGDNSHLEVGGKVTGLNKMRHPCLKPSF